MLKFTTFLLLASSALALDLSEDIKSGDFWKKNAQESLQNSHYELPDDSHLRTTGISFGEMRTGEVIINLNNELPLARCAPGRSLST